MNDKYQVDYFLTPNDNAEILAGRKAAEAKRQLGDSLETQRINERNRYQQELHAKHVQKEYLGIMHEKDARIRDLKAQVGHAEEVILRLVYEAGSFKKTIELLAKAWTPEQVEMVNEILKNQFDQMQNDQAFKESVQKNIADSLRGG